MNEDDSFIAAVREIFETKMGLGRIPLDQELERVEGQKGSVRLEVFRTGRIEKVVLSTITIARTGVSETSALVWPEDGHDLPVFWGNLTRIPGVMNVAILDFIPLVDVVLWPDYIERYMSTLAEVRASALGLLAGCVLDGAVDLPSPVAFALSPHRVVARISEAGVERIPAVAEAYARAYVTLWDRTHPLPAGLKRELCLDRKAALRGLMRANDPGHPHMVGAFGEQLTTRIFDAVF